MIILDCKQGSLEWEQARIGIPTASRFHEIVEANGNPSDQRKKYMWELAGERRAKRQQESFKSKEMERGNLKEAEARSLYEFLRDVEVQEVGFCYLDENKLVGASPDGLVGFDGGLEIKTAKLSVQVERLLANELPAGKMQQIQGRMYVTGRKWRDFMSYSSGLKPLIIRELRNDEFIHKLSTELSLFCAELEICVAKIK